MLAARAPHTFTLGATLGVNRMRPIGVALLSALVFLLPAAANSNGPTIERLAYETYVGCYNQFLWHLERDRLSDALRTELDGCRELARRVLVRSADKSSARYLAYFVLLNTDGGESELNSEAIERKRRIIGPFLQEAANLAGQSNCLIPGTRLADPAENLCASAGTVGMRVGLFFSPAVK